MQMLFFNAGFMIQENYRPSDKNRLCKQQLPNCTLCYGCNTKLSMVHGTDIEFLGVKLLRAVGASNNYIMEGTTDRMPGGKAIVKVFCVPFNRSGWQWSVFLAYFSASGLCFDASCLVAADSFCICPFYVQRSALSTLNVDKIKTLPPPHPAANLHAHQHCRLGRKTPTCGRGDRIRSLLQTLISIQQLALDCGFEGIIPQIWVDEINTVLPNSGYHVR